jgi:hypothetical protein
MKLDWKKLLFFIFTFAAILACLPCCSKTTTSTPPTQVFQISVQPGSTSNFTIGQEIPPGGRISMHFTVKGGDNADIVFSTRYPDGQDYSQMVFYVGDYDNSYPSGGTLQFIFDNTFDKTYAKLIEGQLSIIEPGK